MGHQINGLSTMKGFQAMQRPLPSVDMSAQQ